MSSSCLGTRMVSIRRVVTSRVRPRLYCFPVNPPSMTTAVRRALLIITPPASRSRARRSEQTLSVEWVGSTTSAMSGSIELLENFERTKKLALVAEVCDFRLRGIVTLEKRSSRPNSTKMLDRWNNCFGSHFSAEQILKLHAPRCLPRATISRIFIACGFSYTIGSWEIPST